MNKGGHYILQLITFCIVISNGLSIYTSINSLPNLKEGFSQFDLGLPLGVKPLSYTDINNDKYIDIIASCKEGTAITICYYVYNEEEGKFTKAEQNDPSLRFENADIVGCVANDLNQDSYMDLVLTLEDTNTKKVFTNVYIMNKTTNLYEIKYAIENAARNPFIADLGDERGLNMMVYKDGRRIFLTFNSNGDVAEKEFSSLIPSNLNICDASAKHNKYKLLSHNSNGYVDMDGDCLNDLLIMSVDESNQKYLEIWKSVLENNQIKYCLTSSNVYPLDSNLGLFSIVDVDRNAMPDIVFPILNSYPPKIVVAYNKVAIKYDWTDNYCDTHPASTISSGMVPTFFEQIRPDVNNNFISTITLTKDDQVTFYTNNNDDSDFLRFIDINQDSYPDFITILYNKSSTAKTPYIFLSQEIIYAASYKGDERRTFSKENIYSFSSISNANFVSFFDFGDKGKMGVIVTDASLNTIGLYNHNVYDAYSMKSFLLFKTNCFYCSELGSSQRFITTNIDGTRRMDLSVQAPQPSIALLPSFAYIGIGRSNNYIENFHIISGNEAKRDDNDRVYTPVIPNSQLVIFHDKKEGATLTSWKVDLIVKPTKNLKLLIFVIVLMIVIMTAVAAYLQMKEREEDSIENKETFAPWFG